MLAALPARRPWGRRAVLFVALCAAGCGGGSPTAAVTGTVKHKGKPVAGATVTFAPVNPTAGKAAVGTTDDAGAFALTTQLPNRQSGAGAVPGDYKVIVSKFVPPDGLSDADYQKKLDEDEAKRAKSGYNPDQTVPPKVEALPPDASDFHKTKLKATVTAGGPNTFSFDIP